MFDIGATELLVIVIVAILVIGPKDLPLALRTAGRWLGKVRRVSAHFRSGVEAMMREAELEEMERKWREQNARIMAEHPEQGADEPVMEPLPPAASPPPEDSGTPANDEGLPPPPPPSGEAPESAADDEPQLPLGKPAPPR